MVCTYLVHSTDKNTYVTISRVLWSKNWCTSCRFLFRNMNKSWRRRQFFFVTFLNEFDFADSKSTLRICKGKFHNIRCDKKGLSVQIQKQAAYSAFWTVVGHQYDYQWGPILTKNLKCDACASTLLQETVISRPSAGRHGNCYSSKNAGLAAARSVVCRWWCLHTQHATHQRCLKIPITFFLRRGACAYRLLAAGVWIVSLEVAQHVAVQQNDCQCRDGALDVADGDSNRGVARQSL